MRKAAITVKGEWGQQRTKYPATSKFVAPNDLTAGSKNYQTNVEGILTKRNGGLVYNPDDLFGTPLKDQYEAIFSDGIRHLLGVQSGEIQYSTGDKTFNAVTNGAGFSAGANFEFALLFDRVYGCNNANAPITYDKTSSYGGVDYSGTVPTVKNMGAQAPATAPTFNSFVGGGSVPDGSYNYKVTYSYYDTSESNGSSASTPVITAVGGPQTIRINIPVGGYGVTARKIYRDLNDGVFRLVGTVSDNTSTTFDDTASIGTSFVPLDNNPPPIFGQIIQYLDRAWVAQVIGEPYTLRFSGVATPDIFLSNNFILCNQGDPITGFAIYLDRIIVFNRQSMGQVVGRTTDAFRYSNIQGSVGCVDNRSIQVRTIRGVPTLIWLSDKGVYGYNGNSVEYLSDAIEDLVNLNIQQAVRSKDKRQETVNFTTIDPQKLWDDEADWDGGLVKQDVLTKDNANNMSMTTRFDPSISGGSFSGTELKFGRIQLPTRTPIGSSFLNSARWSDWGPRTNGPGFSTVNAPTGHASKFTIDRAGTITTHQMQFYMYQYIGMPSVTCNMKVWSDAAGSPGSELFSQQFIESPAAAHTVFMNTWPSLHLAAGAYWVGYEFLYPNPGGFQEPFGGPFVHWGEIRPRVEPSATGNGFSTYKVKVNGTWLTAASAEPLLAWPLTSPGAQHPTTTKIRAIGSPTSYSLSQNVFPTSPSMNFGFTEDTQSASGSWTSTIYDTKNLYLQGTINIDIGLTGMGSGKTIKTSVQGSNNQTSWITEGFDSQTGAGASQTFNFVPSTQYRYWRIKIELITTDDQSTQGVFSIAMTFPTTGTWESEVIDGVQDANFDSITYDSLTTVSTVPAGTTVTTTIATSVDGAVFPDGFVTFGTQVNRRYSKVRVIMTTNVNNDTSPSVSSIDLRWTIVRTIESAVVNTNLVGGPAGWDIFQADFAENGGIVAFNMRSDASPSTGTYFSVTSGNFPPTSLPTEQYVQWKATITATPGNVPVVTTGVVNWLVTDVPSIRVASLFFNRTYYLAAAEFNETTNSVVLVLDGEGKWRVWEDMEISTIGLFFNDPYYGDATEGKVIRMFEGFKDKGTTNIEFDIRSKAFDFSSEEADMRYVRKVVQKLKVSGVGTGATYNAYYSVDGGQTFISFVTDDGSTSFTTTDDDQPFEIRLKAKHDLGSSYSGRTVMWRLFNNDDKETKIEAVRLEALTRRGEVSENV